MEKGMPTGRIIPADATGEVEHWRLPEVDAADGERCAPVTAREIEAIQKAAWEEGFAQGHREGLAAGAREIAQKVAELDALMNTLVHPLERLDEEVEAQLVHLCTLLTRHLVRRELRTAPEEILGTLREALGLLPVRQRQVRIVLHPEDAELVRTHWQGDEEERDWKLVEDPTLSRGGCRVETESSRIDATVEQR
ncbi:MAG: flagellar assembly protein FliH, partial [Gammaproteobacteria bacterium]